MEKEPLIISFVSGKGGVGKTMLSVSFSREISNSYKTLVIDLDFFNRGLSGLLKDGEFVAAINKPSFLSPEKNIDKDQWKIIKDSEKLHHLSYPDISSDDFQILESYTAKELKEKLAGFINDIIKIHGFECVVLDCHGGPDKTSFAACLLSKFSLLVSEPDKITFYGTLNFVRQLEKASDGEQFDIRLIFNKVIPSFSPFYLRNLYNKSIKQVFKSKPLLAIFPFEYYLTKEFEKTTFLTESYPDSYLARKIKIIIYDLLQFASLEDKIDPYIKSIPGFTKKYWRITLGKKFSAFELNTIMAVALSGVCLLALFYSLFDNRSARKNQEIKNELYRLAIITANNEDSTLFIDKITFNQYLNREITRSQFLEQIIPDTIEEKENSEIPTPTYEIFHSVENIIKSISEQSNIPYEVSSNENDFYDDSPVVRSYEYKIFKTNLNFFNKISNRIANSNEIAYTTVLKHIRDKYGFYIVIASFYSYIVEEWASPFAVMILFWLGISLLINWSYNLNTNLIYHCRKKRKLTAIFLFFIILCLWFFPSFIIVDSNKGNMYILILYFLCIFPILISQMIRAVIDIKYQNLYFESILRFIFIIYILILPVLIESL